MNKMQLIICETAGKWAAELVRRLPSSVSLVETRSLPEMWERLKTAPAALVALELTADRSDQLLAALVRLGREFPRVAVIVLAERGLAPWEQIVREAGTVQFFASLREVDEIARLVRHRAAHAIDDIFPNGDESISLEDQILASLPWNG